MVIGHRGGYIGGPENSMKCFRGALANNLDGIEFDVSKDNFSDVDKCYLTFFLTFFSYSDLAVKRQHTRDYPRWRQRRAPPEHQWPRKLPRLRRHVRGVAVADRHRRGRDHSYS